MGKKPSEISLVALGRELKRYQTFKEEEIEDNSEIFCILVKKVKMNSLDPRKSKVSIDHKTIKSQIENSRPQTKLEAPVKHHVDASTVKKAIEEHNQNPQVPVAPIGPNIPQNPISQQLIPHQEVPVGPTHHSQGEIAPPNIVHEPMEIEKQETNPESFKIQIKEESKKHPKIE